jgi:hypothetical protein
MERSPPKREVGGSNPPEVTKKRRKLKVCGVFYICLISDSDEDFPNSLADFLLIGLIIANSLYVRNNNVSPAGGGGYIIVFIIYESAINPRLCRGERRKP